MKRSNLHRGAVDRNLVLAALSGILLVTAGVIVFATSEDPAGASDEAADNFMINLTCRNDECSDPGKMRFADYRRLSEAAVTAGEKRIICPNCGERTAWKRGGFLKPPPVPDPKLVKEAWTNTDGTAPPKRDWGNPDPTAPPGENDHIPGEPLPGDKPADDKDSESSKTPD